MDLTKSDQEVYEKGEVVFLTNTIRSVRMEEWVQEIAKQSGERVDWHQFAGRCVVKALGDLHKVRKAIIRLKDMHDQFLTEACMNYGHSMKSILKDIHLVSGNIITKSMICGLMSVPSVRDDVCLRIMLVGNQTE